MYSVPGCQLALAATQLRNLYLADLSLPERRQVVQSLPQVSPSEKNEQREMGAALAYASYRLHQQIKAASQTARTRICQQQQGNLENRPVQLQLGRFGLTNGDLYYQYNCRAQTAEIQELPECWTIVPIKGGGFVDPHSRLFTLYSNKVACNQYYPLTIQTQEGWVAIMPHLVWQPAPHQLPTQPQIEDRPWDRQLGDWPAGLKARTGRNDSGGHTSDINTEKPSLRGLRLDRRMYRSWH